MSDVAQKDTTHGQKDPWNIGDIYHQAFQIAKKYPVLWWFALATAAGSSANSNIRLPSDNSMSGIQELLKHTDKQSALPLAKVLGAATGPTADLFSQIFQAIPWYFYAILVFELLIAFLLVIVTSLIYQAWAQASLLQGIEASIKHEEPTMEQSSEKAFPLIKSFIWLHLVPPLGFILLSLPLFGMLVFLFVIVPGNLKILIGLLFVLAIFAWVISLLFLAMTSIWAPRKVVVDQLSAQEAFTHALSLAKMKFWKTLLYGICNNLVAIGINLLFIVGPIIVFLIAIFFGPAFFEKLPPAIMVILITVAVMLFIVWIIAMMVVEGIVTTFKAAVWSIAFHKLRRTHEQ